jgi:DNA excision repair protein ERCC-6
MSTLSGETAASEQASPSKAVTGTVKLHREETDTIAEAVAAAADEALDDSTNMVETEDIDEASLLKNLTEGVRNQDDLQRDITYQANLVLIEKEDERDQKRIDKVNSNKDKLLSQRHTQKRKLETHTLNILMRKRLESEIDRIDAEIAALEDEIAQIQQRIDARHQDQQNDNDSKQHQANRRMPNETQREFLIRTGKITPFSRMPERNIEGLSGELTEMLMDAEEEAEGIQPKVDDGEPLSHQHLRLPGFAEEPDSGSTTTAESEFSLRPRKRRRLQNGSALPTAQPYAEEQSSLQIHDASADEDTGGTFTPDVTDIDLAALDDEDDDGVIDLTQASKKRSKGVSAVEDKAEDLTGIDDGNEQVYQLRLQSWVARRSRARRNRHKEQNSAGNENRPAEDNDDVKSEPGDVEGNEDDEEEWFKPAPDAPDHHYENGLKLPGDIYPSLFDYQKTGVQWLGELYAQQVGGIIGDEMGLGKTIQIISFLAGLHYSKKLTKPVIVVAPATVLRQWVNEFHRWWPPLRVSILHTSGSGMLNVRDEHRLEEYEEVYRGRRDKKAPKSHKTAKRIVDRVAEHGHVLVTTYAGLQTYGDILIPIDWGYAVLDEGHKIRNPNTAITIYCKELRTANRVILSGTPMQNNLVELWSLFDFVYPMRLGTLVNFRNQFEIPIKIGGYANATNLQVMTATKCAETLKDAISPYLLQRLKADVAADLPRKSEQVLFCKLTKPQREAYEMFLASDEMTSILNRTRQSLYGIDILRKICNHPDLLDPKLKNMPGYKWGNPNKSGKMQVVRALLEIWKRAGDKTLLFSQGVQMLNVIEEFVKSLEGFKYLRMDGSTNIKDRQTMVDRFNNDPDLHVFLLTTKVGGLGVNLTGANRVIIFDPDWNPSTDVQARERAWRLGQKKEVTIYRLMTAGTIEEKIYHRQIFKQFLADKILKDPRQRQTFHMKDLYDLFTLGSSDGSTETAEMFKGSELQLHNSEERRRSSTANGGVNTWRSFTTPAENPSQDEATGLINFPAAPSERNEADEKEVRAITGVAGVEAFRGDPAESKPSTDESRILEGIFARSGVHSVLQHDQIVNGKRVISADRGMLEREAKRVAAEAAEELRKAGEEARNVPIGTVTWTGEVGEAGRPVNIRRGGGPSSAGILSNLAERQGLTPASAGSSRSGTPNSEREPRGKDFMKLIRDYIRRQGGSVPSQMLVVHFNNMCRTSRQTEEFKAMLQEVAVLKRGSGTRMRGKWELKDEFK